MFLDGPANSPCGLHEPSEEWNIWQLASGGMIVGGFADPESAMHYADQLGRFRDWRLPEWPPRGPSLATMMAIVDACEAARGSPQILTEDQSTDITRSLPEATAGPALQPPDPPRLSFDDGGW